MKSKMMAKTMTQMSRLTMLHSEVGERVRDRIALVDRVLEVLEDRLLADEHARIGGAVAIRTAGTVAEERRNGLAVDGVAFLLELPQGAHIFDELAVLVLAQLRDRLVQL